MANEKFVHGGLNQFFDGQIITDSAATALAALGGNSYTPQEVVENIDSLLSSNEGYDARNKKDRNAIIFIGKNLQPLQKGYKVIFPKNDGTDDWASLNNEILAAADKYALYLSPVDKNGVIASFLCATPGNIVSGTTIIGHEKTTIVSTLVPSGTTADTSSVFLSDLYSSLPVKTTLSADLNPGATTLSLTSATGIAINDWIAVRDQAGYRVTTYKVVNLVGTTVTLDRPMVWTDKFASGSEIIRFTTIPLNNVQIIGNGMTVSGTGDRAVSLVASNNCLVQGINVRNATFANYCCSFDLGGFQNTFKNMSVDGGATSVACIALESQERSNILYSKATNAKAVTGDGIRLTTSTQLLLLDCEGTNNPSNGLIIATNSDPGEVTGCRLVRVIGGKYNKNGSNGIRVTYGSSMGEIIGVTCGFNGAAGFEIFNQVAAPVLDWTLTGCVAVNNVYGFIISGASDVTLLSPTTRYNSARGIYIDAGFVTQHGGQLREIAGPPVDLVNAAEYRGFGVLFFCEGVGYQAAVSAQVVNAKVHLTGSVANWLNAVNGPIVDLNNGATVFFKDNQRTGSGTGVGVSFQSATDVGWIEGPCTMNGTGYRSRGTVVANGASSVDLTFPQITATSIVTLTRVTDGGTPGITPKVTITAGTKFSIAGVALDTSTYAYEIR